MEPRGGTSGAKRVDVHMDSSELSASTASNTTLPHLEATDVERALNDNERRRRQESSKEKQEEKEGKLGRRMKKKRRQQMHHQVTYQVVSKMEMMMSPTKCRRGQEGEERKRQSRQQ